MRNVVTKSILVFFLFVLAGSPVRAAEGPLKIGILDLNKAVNESDQGKKAKVELEAYIKGKQAALDELAKKAETLKNELDKQSDIMSAEAKKSKEDELARLSREYQRTASDSQVDVRKKENELTHGIIEKLKNVVKVIFEDENYTIIFEKNDGSVLYSDKTIDITDRVIRKFDESQSKGGKQ